VRVQNSDGRTNEGGGIVKDIKLKRLDDGTFDIDTDTGDEVLISGLDALKQRLEIKLAHIGGEWYLDTKAGGVSFDYLGGKLKDLSIAKRILRESIEEDTEVLAVSRMDASLDNRTRVLSVYFEVSTIYGDYSQGVKI